MVKCANKRYVVITIELMLEYTELKPVLLGAYGIRKCGMLDPTPVLQNPSETYLVDDRWEIDHVLSVLMGCC